jgi:hypothetical protein
MAQRLSMDQVGGERLQPFHPSEWPKVAGPVHLGLLLGKNGPGELGLDVVGAILMIESFKTRQSAESRWSRSEDVPPCKRDQQRSKDD